MRLSTFTAAVAMSIAFTGAASAQDAHSWTGIYAGVNAGGAWGTSCAKYQATAPGSGATYSGGNCPNSGAFIGGAQVGYNYEIENFVLGLEGDIGGATSTTNKYSTVVTNGGVLVPNGTYVATGSHTPGVIATVRARLGYSFDRVLVYFTGGGAFAGSSGSGAITYTAPGDTAPSAIYSQGHTSTRTGWTLGGGLEYALTPNWSLKAEDLFMNFGNAGVPNNCADVNGSTVCQTFPNVAFRSAANAGNVNVFRLGVNYKF